jgi:hypothetical protein
VYLPEARLVLATKSSSLYGTPVWLSFFLSMAQPGHPSLYTFAGANYGGRDPSPISGVSNYSSVMNARCALETRAGGRRMGRIRVEPWGKETCSARAVH